MPKKALQFGPKSAKKAHCETDRWKITEGDMADGLTHRHIDRHLTFYSRMDVAHCGGRPRPDARQLLIDVAHCGGRPE